MNVHRSAFYRSQHVAGPHCVLVSIRFGNTPPGGPTVVRLLAIDRKESGVQFDLANHIAEVLAGVARANRDASSTLEVEAIEVVPDDHPAKGQVEHAAYTIAMAVQRGDI